MKIQRQAAMSNIKIQQQATMYIMNIYQQATINFLKFTYVEFIYIICPILWWILDELFCVVS